MCPAGSTRDSDSSRYSCSCADSLVTQTGNDTTGGDDCDISYCMYIQNK